MKTTAQMRRLSACCNAKVAQVQRVVFEKNPSFCDANNLFPLIFHGQCICCWQKARGPFMNVFRLISCQKANCEGICGKNWTQGNGATTRRDNPVCLHCCWPSRGTSFFCCCCDCAEAATSHLQRCERGVWLQVNTHAMFDVVRMPGHIKRLKHFELSWWMWHNDRCMESSAQYIPQICFAVFTNKSPKEHSSHGSSAFSFFFSINTIAAPAELCMDFIRTPTDTQQKTHSWREREKTGRVTAANTWNQVSCSLRFTERNNEFKGNIR